MTKTKDASVMGPDDKYTNIFKINVKIRKKHIQKYIYTNHRLSSH